VVPDVVSAAVDAPLRVALMLETDGPGGAEVMLLHLAEELRHRGHEVCPVGPDDGCGWLRGQLRERGFETETFSLRRPLDWRCLRGLVRTLRARRVDVVHSHEFTMAVYGAAAARRLGLRHVITMHGGRYFAAQWRRRVAMRWAARRSNELVAVSSATAEHLSDTLGLTRAAVTVIPNGIPFREGSRTAVRHELGVAPDELLLVAVGNLYTVKGHMILLQALAALHRSGEALPWRLAIAGRGDEETPLRSFAESEGLADRVHLLGYRQDVPDILAAGDVFVMPSLSEGLPLALEEAMSASLPVIASNVGGIPEVVEHEREALLTPPGDPIALADALCRLMRDAGMRAALGGAARRRALSDFGVRAMGDAYERLYRGKSVSPRPAPQAQETAGAVVQ
jgi:glycosyltransferase involved in cell wall biosynthesis